MNAAKAPAKDLVSAVEGKDARVSLPLKMENIPSIFRPGEIGQRLDPATLRVLPGWKRIKDSVNGVEIAHIRGDVSSARAHFTILTGLKSTTAYFVNSLIKLNKFGISFDIVNLTDPGEREFFVDEHRAVAHHALIDNVRETDLTHIFCVHSAGGMHAIDLLLEAETAAKMNKKHGGHFDAGIFLDPFLTHSSNPLVRTLYNAHTHINGRKKHGDPIFDRLHSAYKDLQGQPDIHSSTGPVLHPQNRHVIEHGEKIYNRAKKQGFPDEARDLPATFIVGGHDYIACPIAATEVAELMDAEVRWFPDGWHNVLKESRAARRYIMYKVAAWTGRSDAINVKKSWEAVSLPGMPPPTLLEKATLPIILAGTGLLGAFVLNRRFNNHVGEKEEAKPEGISIPPTAGKQAQQEFEPEPTA